AVGVRHDGRVLVKELFEVLELHRLLADVADPDDQRDRLAVVVGPTGIGADAQPGLQAADLLAPGGEALPFTLLRRLLGILHFQFQPPGGELAESGVELDLPGPDVPTNPLVLELEPPRSKELPHWPFFAPLASRSEFE